MFANELASFFSFPCSLKNSNLCVSLPLYNYIVSSSSGHSAESLEHFEPNPALTVNDLLNWCQEVTRGYRGVRITNLTTSWRNGMAFCAIIHHFRPDLIDFSSLRPVDVVDNCQKAFAVAERLGVPALINPDDMNTMSVPDKLSVMTYLYELRSYFTNAAQQQQQRTPNARKSLNFTDVVDEIGNSRASMEVQEKCLDLFTRLDDIEGTAFSPKLDVAGADGGKKSTLSTSTVAQLLDGYKLLTSKLISSSKNEQNEDNVSKSGSSSSSSSLNKLMTRKQLMNPFDSDSDDEGDSSIKYDSKGEFGLQKIFLIFNQKLILMSQREHFHEQQQQERKSAHSQAFALRLTRWRQRHL